MVETIKKGIETESIPSVKDLASSEPSLRRKNLQQIISHLESRSPKNCLTRTQALQLWRGFHVALYMHDSKNQLSVQTLIVTLANTFKTIRSKDIELSLATGAETSSAQLHANTADTDDDQEGFAGFDDDNDDGDTNQAIDPSREVILDTTWLGIYSVAFWETVSREWSGVDQWRMNKYLLLVRLALREIFSICLSAYLGLEDDQPSSTDIPEKRQLQGTANLPKKRKPDDHDCNGGDPQIKKAKASVPSSLASQANPGSTSTMTRSLDADQVITNQMQILCTNPLSPRDRKVSDGLRLHMLDIYLDELFTVAQGLLGKFDAKVDIETGRRKVDLAPVLRKHFLEPVRQMSVNGLAKHVRARAKDVLGEFDGRIKEW